MRARHSSRTIDQCKTPAGRPASSGPPDPFAALPHRIAGDPQVTPLGKAVLLALLFWARGKDHCWPSDRSIGLRVGRSEATVQRALRQLQDLGLIDRQKTGINRTGRVIRLLWRIADKGIHPANTLGVLPAKDWYPMPTLEGPARSAVMPTHPAVMRDEENGIVKGDAAKEMVEIPVQRPRPEPMVPAPEVACPVSNPPPPSPTYLIGLTPAEQARLRELPEATRDQVLQWLALGDPICLGEARRLLAPPPAPEPGPQTLATPELLRSLPGRPDRVVHAAGRLSGDLGDPTSYRYYQALAEAVCSRQQPAEALIAAWSEGTGPRARRPGAVFATAWKRETRRPEGLL